MAPTGDAASLFPAETYTVSELGHELKTLLGEAYWSIWVVGEVQRVKTRGSHVYFELVEKGHGDRVEAKIDVALFRRDRLRVERLLREAGQELADGQMMRCRGQVDFYPPFGRIQFVARDVDPVYGLGVLEQRRQETLQWLEEHGLLECNSQLELAPAPTTIGLVTAPDSAAFHDFVSTLEHSGFGFRIVFAPARVQGGRAERSVSGALESLVAWHAERLAGARVGLDCIVVARGGGSKTDLQAFDSRTVARRVAESPVPVWTGIGHEIDESIVDRVAHTRFKTPTGVAEALVARVAKADERRLRIEEGIALAARRRLDSAAERLQAAAGGAISTRHRLERSSQTLRELRRSLAVAGRVRLKQQGAELEGWVGRMPKPVFRRLVTADRRRVQVAEALARSGGRLVDRRRLQVEGLWRIAEQLSPRRVLERGFSVTRDERGRVVRSAAELRRGERLATELAAGAVVSTVEEVTGAQTSGGEGDEA